MSIWDRIARAARAEFTEMKRVLADRDDAPAGTPEEARQRALREAEDELARAERDINVAELEMGSYRWETRRETAAASNDLDRGASLWGDPAPSATPTNNASAAPAATPSAMTPVVDPRAAIAPAEGGRPRAISMEVRDAYAALELPLGAEAEAVYESHAALTTRFHPDRFGDDPDRARIAEMVRARIDAARQIVLGWLATRTD